MFLKHIHSKFKDFTFCFKKELFDFKYKTDKRFFFTNLLNLKDKQNFNFQLEISFFNNYSIFYNICQ